MVSVIFVSDGLDVARSGTPSGVVKLNRFFVDCGSGEAVEVGGVAPQNPGQFWIGNFVSFYKVVVGTLWAPRVSPRAAVA